MTGSGASLTRSKFQILASDKCSCLGQNEQSLQSETSISSFDSGMALALHRQDMRERPHNSEEDEGRKEEMADSLFVARFEGEVGGYLAYGVCRK